MRPSQKQEPLDWRLIQAGSRSPAYQRCLLGHHCANNGRIEVHAPYLPTPYLCLTCLAQELGMARLQLQAEIPNHLAHPYQLAQPDGSCNCQQDQPTGPEESTTEEDAMRTNHLSCHLGNDDTALADRLQLAHLAGGLDNRRPNPVNPEHSQIYTSPPLTLWQMADQCRNDPELRRRTEALRGLLQNPNNPPPSFHNGKLRLPAIAPALSLEAGQTLTGVNLAQCHTGLYGYDLDEELPEDPAAFANLLTQLPGAVLAGHSIRGRHYLFVLGPPAVTEGEYQANWLRIMASYPAIVQRSSGQQSKNSNRLRTLVHDPDLWLTPDPEPTPWQPPAQPTLPTPASPKQSRPAAAQPPAKQPPARRQQAEDLLDRDALQHIAPPQEYNQARFNAYRTLEIRASAVGNCRRSLWYEATGHQVTNPRGDDSLTMLEAGNALEPVVLQAMQRAGWRITPTDRNNPGMKSLLIGHPTLLVSGHVDATGVAPPDGCGAPTFGNEPSIEPCIIEVKTRGPEAFRRWQTLGAERSHPESVWQAACYTYGTFHQARDMVIATSDNFLSSSAAITFNCRCTAAVT